jgi:Ca2+-binding RTX toxin-like protein
MDRDGAGVTTYVDIVASPENTRTRLRVFASAALGGLTAVVLVLTSQAHATITVNLVVEPGNPSMGEGPYAWYDVRSGAKRDRVQAVLMYDASGKLRAYAFIDRRGVRGDKGCAEVERSKLICRPGRSYKGTFGGASFDLRRGDDRLRIRAAGRPPADGSPVSDLRAYGNDGDDVMIGSPAADVLRGGPGDDVLRGGDGQDLVDGGIGRDSLYGGPGLDFLTATGDGVADRVIDCGEPTTPPGSYPRESAVIDLTDPEPVGCENVERVTRSE